MWLLWTIMKIFYIVLICEIFGVLGGPINTDPAPGRSPGPPSGMSIVQEGHNGIVENIPTLLLTKDPTDFGKNTSSSRLLSNKSSLESSVRATETTGFLAKTSVKTAKRNLPPCSERSKVYLKPTDGVFRVKFNQIEENESFSEKSGPPFQIDITHDLYFTNNGLLLGLIYTVTLECSSSLHDFFVESLIDGHSGGSFIDSSDTAGKLSSSRQHRWPQRPFGAMSSTSSTIIRERRNKDAEWITQRPKSWHHFMQHEETMPSSVQNEKHEINCVKNSWSRSLLHGANIFTIKWMIPNVANNENSEVSFRISYRTEGVYEKVFETEISYPLIRDCNLYLKHISGTFDSTSLPINQKDCNIFFPSEVLTGESMATVSSYTRPGILIHLTRLNVPCSEEGFVELKKNRRLCGKLEELPHNERTYYFADHTNTSLRVYNHAYFAIDYKIVDYCYNVTLSQRNQTFFLQPMGSLECSFKIHIPYGYKINLMLTLNAHNVTETTKQEFVELANQLSHNNATETMCAIKEDSLHVKVFDPKMDRRWMHCYAEYSTSRKISMISSDNLLIVSVQKFNTKFLGDSLVYLPSLQVEYSAQSIESIVSQCAFGWIAYQHFCISTIEDRLHTWTDAESECQRRSGHLVSVKSEQEQKILDGLVLNSPGYENHIAYWIGASDKNYEGDFHWSDDLPFSYSNWFPGWTKYKDYNRQPNDDGLSSQDCVEMRRLFRLPPGNQINEAPLTSTFMWNDRDCEAKNYFICERPMIEEPALDSQWKNDCNKTIQLTTENSKVNVWSPGFPHPYPDNVNCLTFITAPPTHRIIIDFEELVLEDEPQCSYDMLELSEPEVEQQTTEETQPPFIDFAHYQAMLNSSNQKGFNVIVDEDDKNVEVPNFVHTDFVMPRKLCGDWSSKLKLLRHTTKSSALALHFVSDYSHHFSGYKAKVYIDNALSECGDDRQKLYNKSCYLFVSYPEVNFWTAQQVCRSIGAELTSVGTVDEQRFITSSIRNDVNYSPRGIYWLGGIIGDSGNIQWSDESEITFQDFLPGELNSKDAVEDEICIGLQWKMSQTSMLPSGLYWSRQKCLLHGGYVCKKKLLMLDRKRIRNHTVTGQEGRLTSPDYPSPYPLNIDYMVRIVSPERTRIVLQFQRIDLEPQEKCLYDYVSVSSVERQSDVDPGTNPIPMAMFTDIVDEWKAQKKRSIDLETTEQNLKNHIKLLEKTNHLIQIRKRRIRTTRIANKEWNNVDNFPSFSSYVRWCGNYENNMSRFDFISTSNQALVHFHSDYSISRTGFSATWTAIDITGCPEQTLTSKEGVFSSPNYPHFLLDRLECAFVLQAPIGKKVWLEFIDFDIIDDVSVIIDLGDGEFHPFSVKNVLNDGVFLSAFEKLKVILRTGLKPKGRGFKATYKTTGYPVVTEERMINLNNVSSGTLLHLNYPLPSPPDVDFIQHLMVPLGEVITLELHGVTIGDGGNCSYGSTLEVYDNYADNNGTVWVVCSMETGTTQHPQSGNRQKSYPPVFITSYLNTLHIRQHTKMGADTVSLNATIKIHPDTDYKPKLASKETWVESCLPNPCKFGGKCITSGSNKRCQCRGHHSGRFCGLTICDFDPCIFGQCELTTNNFRCNCLPGYKGETCDQKQKPCSDNPCQGRGDCFEKNGGFFCRCHAWWEGQKCERKMIHIPYKPLSERMLQEPFWLGLITVFVVLAIIGLVWCAKRHFPDKIEKLLTEESDRTSNMKVFYLKTENQRFLFSGGAPLHSHHTSLREQLQFTTSIPQTTIATPGAPRTIFGRLGIRKPSILSLSSPQPNGGAAARTFSLDDLLRPPPRRTPSPRKKRNNSTPSRKNPTEKKQILQQLISPALAESKTKLNLGELIQFSDNHLKPTVVDNESDAKETSFTESASTAASLSALRSIPIPDPKLEKKVTFARLLNKVSAEISSGSDMEVGALSSNRGLNLPIEMPTRASSVPPSPCINEIRTPPSTSSNQGSDSLSSSDLALADIGKTSRRIKSKVSSADSILAMFKNFNNAPLNLSPSYVISPSTTPTASSPQDDAPGDDDSSTSSMHTPVSFSSGTPDSPVFYRQSTIEVPVLDPLSAHKSAPNSNLLHPPTILLEIPCSGNGAINKCLSPIREMPTPMPSPALTPIMPRPQKSRSPSPHNDPLDFSDEENKMDQLFQTLSQHVLVTFHPDNTRTTTDSETENFSMDTTTSDPLPYSARSKFKSRIPVMSISIDIDPPTPEGEEAPKPSRPRDLVIPTLTIETPSPTKTTPPVQMFLGSPPPQRASIGDASMLTFPNKYQHKRLLKQLEKPTSLDLTFTPPLITITSSLSEVESDMDNMSPAPGKIPTTSHLCVPGSTGMCYLSPFTTVTRNDRTTSEGNLSSSGYSSMASPGPSRCNSNNPLCLSENEEPGTGSSRSSLNIPPSGGVRRQGVHYKNTQGTTVSGSTGGSAKDHQERMRNRSDSETLSDEMLLESNDEGIGTDHIDEKAEDGEGKRSRDFELCLGTKLIDEGKTLLLEEPMTMAQLQLPSIVIQDSNDKCLSPVSSRSESPLSERMTGIGRFSPLFYGKKDQQLPFTDSDGLYDFPSSDGKGAEVSHGSTHRKNTGKKRERRPSLRGLSQSPSKSCTQLELPNKESSQPSQHSSPSSKYNLTACRKSPKRRPLYRLPVASSSSSSESLISPKDLSPKIKIASLKGSAQHSATITHPEPGDDKKEAMGKKTLLNMLSPNESILPRVTPVKKINRLRAIGNQIRFLKRLEQSIKSKNHQVSATDSCNDDTSDNFHSTRVTSPLLSSPSAYTSKARSSPFRTVSRQKRVHGYENPKATLIDRHRVSPSDIVSD
ncbi:C-type lectin-like [Sergentomyia squamirostris]